MTLDELCHTVHRTPIDLERWAQLGALGDRWKEPRNSGKWRHITKEVAGRAIVMDRLVQIGMEEQRAAWVARAYKRTRDLGELETSMHGIKVVIDLKELDLP